MTKNIIIVILLGLLVMPKAYSSIHGVICNKLDFVSGDNYHDLYTTKVTAPEGSYRVFIYEADGVSVGISVLKIK